MPTRARLLRAPGSLGGRGRGESLLPDSKGVLSLPSGGGWCPRTRTGGLGPCPCAGGGSVTLGSAVLRGLFRSGFRCDDDDIVNLLCLGARRCHALGQRGPRASAWRHLSATPAGSETRPGDGPGLARGRAWGSWGSWGPGEGRPAGRPSCCAVRLSWPRARRDPAEPRHLGNRHRPQTTTVAGARGCFGGRAEKGLGRAHRKSSVGVTSVPSPEPRGRAERPPACWGSAQVGLLLTLCPRTCRPLTSQPGLLPGRPDGDRPGKKPAAAGTPVPTPTPAGRRPSNRKTDTDTPFLAGQIRPRTHRWLPPV